MTILTEKNNPETDNIDLMSAYEIVRLINAEDQKVALAVEKVLEPVGKAVEIISRSFLRGGRLAYFGAGTSGRIGVLDASECPPTFGVDEGLVNGFVAGGDKALRFAVEDSEDNENLARADFANFGAKAGDVVVGISASGNPLYVLSVLKAARAKKCHTIGICSNPEAQMKDLCDVFICPLLGPEVIAGSSRMKSGTAQKMILNMLSTGSMIRIGKTYRNYMIDLRMLNQKLVARGCRFVCQICKVDPQTAEKTLAESGQNVKTACVMILKNCTRREAEEKLRQAGGFLRKVIENEKK